MAVFLRGSAFCRILRRLKLSMSSGAAGTDTEPLISAREGYSPSFITKNRWDSIKVPFLAVSYCAISISAVFINKILLSPSGKYKGFGSVEFLMMVQSILGVIILLIFRSIGAVQFPILLDRSKLLKIAAVNILFIIMTVSNAYGIKQLSIQMVAMLKNSQVVLVAILEYFFLGTRPSKATISSLIIIVFGSICGSLSDIEFNLIGYISMGFCVLSSALYYVLIKTVFQKEDVPELSLVFYNNLFSVPFFLGLSLKKHNFFSAIQYIKKASASFWSFMIISGFTGAGVNLTTYLFLASSSPTTFSVLGIIKKITQTLLGYLLWTSPTNVSNVISVFVGILGGISYSIAKQKEKSAKESAGNKV